ncbi:MAG: class I SAM-dependent methyltransferase [Planctomycetota bacterium]|jgi:SAM-dependent methyltransferase
MNESTEKKTKLAFGIEPSTRRYRLRLARYPAMAEEIAAFVNEQNIKKDEKLNLLDIGVGSGRSMRFTDVTGVSDRIEFFGIDRSKKRLDNIYCPHRWTLKQCDIDNGNIPFDSEMFDIVVCEQVIEHLHNPGTSLLEMSRLLRPGGLLIIGTAATWPGISLAYRYLVPIFDRVMGIKRGHLQIFTCRSFKRLIKNTGDFSILKTRGFRIASGGLIAWLENFHFWYRFNRALGRIIPTLCPDIQIIAIKTSSNKNKTKNIPVQ